MYDFASHFQIKGKDDDVAAYNERKKPPLVEFEKRFTKTVVPLC